MHMPRDREAALLNQPVDRPGCARVARTPRTGMNIAANKPDKVTRAVNDLMELGLRPKRTPEPSALVDCLIAVHRARTHAAPERLAISGTPVTLLCASVPSSIMCISTSVRWKRALRSHRVLKYASPQSAIKLARVAEIRSSGRPACLHRDRAEESDVKHRSRCPHHWVQGEVQALDGEEGAELTPLVVAEREAMLDPPRHDGLMVTVVYDEQRPVRARQARSLLSPRRCGLGEACVVFGVLQVRQARHGKARSPIAAASSKGA